MSDVFEDFRPLAVRAWVMMSEGEQQANGYMKALFSIVDAIGAPDPSESVVCDLPARFVAAISAAARARGDAFTDVNGPQDDPVIRRARMRHAAAHSAWVRYVTGRSPHPTIAQSLASRLDKYNEELARVLYEDSESRIRRATSAFTYALRSHLSAIDLGVTP